MTSFDDDVREQARRAGESEARAVEAAHDVMVIASRAVEASIAAGAEFGIGAGSTINTVLQCCLQSLRTIDKAQALKLVRALCDIHEAMDRDDARAVKRARHHFMTAGEVMAALSKAAREVKQ